MPPGLATARSAVHRRHAIEIQPFLDPPIKIALRQALRTALDQGSERWRLVLAPALVYEAPDAGNWWWSIALTSSQGAVQLLLVAPDDQAPASVGEAVSKAIRGELLMALCSACKRLRTKSGRWHRRMLPKELLHATHGICPECARELYPELMPKLEQKHAGH